jgi:hypothetical protein
LRLSDIRKLRIAERRHSAYSSHARPATTIARAPRERRAGAQLYFDRINAAGGIHGAKIRLVTKDDGYKVPETVRLTHDLIRESGPIALIGLVGTGNIEALVKEGVLTEADIPVVELRDALEWIRDYDAGGLVIRFSQASHAGSDFLDITILGRDGKVLS